MQNLQINDGVIRLAINGDPDNILEFNPSDTLFMKKYMLLIKGFWAKLKEMEAAEEKFNAEGELDEAGIPTNIDNQIELLEDVCMYVRQQIDEVFGEGVSKRLFGNVLSIEVFKQLFDGITPYIQETRVAKVEQYIPKKTSTRKKPVMK